MAQDPDTARTESRWLRMLRWTTRLPAVIVLAGGLAVTGILTGAAQINYLGNARRLLELEAHLAASSLQALPADATRQLGEAVAQATLDGGTPGAFESSTAPLVEPRGSLRVVELFKVHQGVPTLIATSGGAAADRPGSLQLAHLIAKSSGGSGLVLDRIGSGPGQRIGLALAGPAVGGDTYVVYGERGFPADQRVTIEAHSPYASLATRLDFAVYWGRRANTANLLESSATVPLRGTTTSVQVPIGNQVLTFVVEAVEPLSGVLAESVPWLILTLGVTFSLAAGLGAEWLVRRGKAAEAEASESQRRWAQERSVSERFQRALLPHSLPETDGVRLASRYVPGEAGIEVGGDWYDVLVLDDGRLFFCVGDVTGHGVEAAVLMGELRHALNALARDSNSPGSVLTKVSRQVDVIAGGRFATAVCGRLDPQSGTVEIANAGHLPMVLVTGGRGTLLDSQSLGVPAGPPLGVGTRYPVATRRLEPGSTLLAVTDGLVERRGESLEDGLERLRAAAASDEPLEELLDQVLEGMVSGGAHDDVAMLGIRWAPRQGAAS